MTFRTPSWLGALLIALLTSSMGACQAFLSTERNENAPIDAGADAVTDGGIATDASVVPEAETLDPPGIWVRSAAVVEPTKDAVRVTLARPPGTRPGDLLWAVIDVSTGDQAALTVNPAPPFEPRSSQWSQGPGPCAITQPSNLHVFSFFLRRAGTDEPTEYAFAFEALHQASGAIVAVAGVDVANPVADQIGADLILGAPVDDITVRYVPPKLNTTVAGALALYFLGDIAGGVWDVANPVDAGRMVVNNKYMAVYAETLPEAGAPLGREFLVTNHCIGSNGLAKLVTLRPK